MRRSEGRAQNICPCGGVKEDISGLEASSLMAATRVWLVTCVIVAMGVGMQSVFVSNLDADCLRCLCQGSTGCNMTMGCLKGYCGPFYISHLYWADADKHVLPEDDPERDGAYGDCANVYSCAKNIVENYMADFGKDCNGDGVTDCDDYAMVHFNGGYSCEESVVGKPFHTRYTKCRQPTTIKTRG